MFYIVRRWYILVFALALSSGVLLIAAPYAFASSGNVYHPRLPMVLTLPQDPLGAFWRMNMFRLHPQPNDNCSISEEQWHTTPEPGGYSVDVALWVPFEVNSPYNFCGYVYGTAYATGPKNCSGIITAEVAIRNAGLHGGNDPQQIVNGMSSLSFSDDETVSAGTLVDGAGVLNVGEEYIAYAGSSDGQPKWYDIPSRNG